MGAECHHNQAKSGDRERERECLRKFRTCEKSIVPWRRRVGKSEWIVSKLREAVEPREAKSEARMSATEA